MGQLTRRLGTEKIKDIKTSEMFDAICDQYQTKAKEEGYNGELLFKKEKGNMVIFVTIEP